MRFSLATLILVSLFLAALLGLSVRLEPWYSNSGWHTLSRSFSFEELKALQPRLSMKSPDGTSELRYMICSAVLRSANNPFEPLTRAGYQPLGFVDNDTVLIHEEDPRVRDAISDPEAMREIADGIFAIHWHPPVWRWENLHLPELWITIVLGMLLLRHLLVAGLATRRSHNDAIHLSEKFNHGAAHQSGG